MIHIRKSFGVFENNFSSIKINDYSKSYLTQYHMTPGLPGPASIQGLGPQPPAVISVPHHQPVPTSSVVIIPSVEVYHGILG
jgi:hypothetical protein